MGAVSWRAQVCLPKSKTRTNSREKRSKRMLGSDDGLSSRRRERMGREKGGDILLNFGEYWGWKYGGDTRGKTKLCGVYLHREQTKLRGTSGFSRAGHAGGLRLPMGTSEKFRRGRMRSAEVKNTHTVGEDSGFLIVARKSGSKSFRRGLPTGGFVFFRFLGSAVKNKISPIRTSH